MSNTWPDPPRNHWQRTASLHERITVASCLFVVAMHEGYGRSPTSADFNIAGERIRSLVRSPKRPTTSANVQSSAHAMPHNNPYEYESWSMCCRFGAAAA